MSFSLNKVQLIGNLGKDSETRFTNNNLPVTKFSVATTYSVKGSDGNWKDDTTWHNVVGFNLSEYYQRALVKGAKVFVEGRINKNEYTDKEGIKRYSVEVIVEKLIPLDSNSNSNGNGNGSQRVPTTAPNAADVQIPTNDEPPI